MWTVVRIVLFVVLLGLPVYCMHTFITSEQNNSLRPERLDMPVLPLMEDIYATPAEAATVAGIGCFVVGVLCVFLLFGRSGGGRLTKLRRRAQQLQRRIAELEAENEVLRKRGRKAQEEGGRLTEREPLAPPSLPDLPDLFDPPEDDDRAPGEEKPPPT